MAYFPEGMPLPQPADRDELPFFEACKRKELVIQRCADCRRFRHPPVPVCAHCGSFKTEWAKVPGTGTVFSFTVAYHPVHPALRDAVPYNVAYILLDEADDVRLVSNVMDAKPEEMRIGLRVRLEWDPTSDGSFLPRFRKA